MPNRNLVFVSHANPEDNAFARWLSLKVAGLDYQVWSDVTKLLGGEDIWSDIEPIIRDSAAKFLYVLSGSSNHREGPLRELRVANAVRKAQEIKDFIIPVRLDDLPYGDINIELAGLNVVDFSKSWASGLKQLCEKFAADAVPKSASSGPDVVRQWWEREFAADNGVTDAPEPHYSNWFPLRLPERIHRYSTVGPLLEPEFSFPTRWHNLQLVTFGPRSDVEPGLLPLRIREVEEIETRRYLSEGRFPLLRDQRNIVTELLNDAWERFATQRALKRFTMARNRQAFYFDMDALPNPNVSFVSVAGGKTYRGLMGYKTRASGKLRHWHFAVSANAAVHPQPMLKIRAHVLFSDDGRQLWSSPDAMHRARRSQCKAWWNDDWRDRILATMAWLAQGADALILPLSLSSAAATVDPRPLEFLSPVTLKEPSPEPETAVIADPREDEDDEGEDESEAAHNGRAAALIVGRDK